MPVSTTRTVTEEVASAPVRRALLALCYAYTHDTDAAQDLVQETLVEVLRRADALPRPESWRPWMYGVARNVCRRWREDRQREQRVSVLTAAHEQNIPAKSDTGDADDSVERIRLLKWALTFLPDDARLLLRAVVEERMSHTDAAKCFQLSPNMVAVRLHRHKQALRKIMVGEPSLRAFAAEYGVLLPDDGWQQTSLWCRWCGKHRMQVRTVYGGASATLTRVDVHCPGCNPRRLPLADATTQNAAFDAIHKSKGYMAALGRLNTELGDWYAGASRGEAMPCWHCGRRAARLLPAPTAKPVAGRTKYPVYIFCSSCHREMFASPSGIALRSLPFRHFAHIHGRVHILPEREVTVGGCPALLIGFESLGAVSGSIEIVLRRDTFALLRAG